MDEISAGIGYFPYSESNDFDDKESVPDEISNGHQKSSKARFNLRVNAMNGSVSDSSEEDYPMEYESTDGYDDDSFCDPESLRSMADPNPRAAVRRRKKYTIEFREDVVAYSKNHTIKDTSEKFNINTAMVAMWRKNVCGRKAKYMSIEREVLKFYKECQAANTEITRTMIKEKAKEVYNSLKFSQNNGPKKKEFVASDSWVHRFLSRNKLSIPGDALKKVASKSRRSSSKTNIHSEKIEDYHKNIDCASEPILSQNKTKSETELRSCKEEDNTEILKQ